MVLDHCILHLEVGFPKLYMRGLFGVACSEHYLGRQCVFSHCTT